VTTLHQEAALRNLPEKVSPRPKTEASFLGHRRRSVAVPGAARPPRQAAPWVHVPEGEYCFAAVREDCYEEQEREVDAVKLPVAGVPSQERQRGRRTVPGSPSVTTTFEEVVYNRSMDSRRSLNEWDRFTDVAGKPSWAATTKQVQIDRVPYTGHDESFAPAAPAYTGHDQAADPAAEQRGFSLPLAKVRSPRTPRIVTPRMAVHAANSAATERRRALLRLPGTRQSPR